MLLQVGRVLLAAVPRSTTDSRLLRVRGGWRRDSRQAPSLPLSLLRHCHRSMNDGGILSLQRLCKKVRYISTGWNMSDSEGGRSASGTLGMSVVVLISLLLKGSFTPTSQ